MSNKNIEIRKLKPGQINDLAKILDDRHDWMKLMSCITTNYSSEHQHEDYKYTANDIRSIQQAGERGSCTEILMSEWGTSGKERPTVRVLLKFLLKADLLRAAHYVAEKLLNEPLSERPSGGDTTTWSKSEMIESRRSIGELPTVECNGIDKSGNISMQFIVEASTAVENRFSQLDIEKKHLINFNVIKACTKSFDPSMVLGRGGFGTVYLGLLDDKKVAIKKLDVHDDDSHLLKQFENELLMLSQGKTHPNILSLLAVSLNEIPCLIYEFMPNGSLDKRLTCQLKEFPPLDWQKRVFIANDINNGLKYLHTAFETPLIHRDIKSGNILLDSEDTAKIGDFGLVRKQANDKTSHTQVFQGTNAYGAPEAFHGTLSVKNDIFSFGVVLLELLTGLPAYDGDREGAESLVDYITERAPESKDFTDLLDRAAGAWPSNVWIEIYDLSKKCTDYSKMKRPDILVVDSTMTRLKEKISEG